jgi:hypothetical protein
MDFDAYAEASAALLGLKIEKEWRDAVTANLTAVMSHARKVDDFALPDESEPAPMFDAFAPAKVS